MVSRRKQKLAALQAERHRLAKEMNTAKQKVGHLDIEVADLIEQILELAGSTEIPPEDIYAMRQTRLVGGKIREILQLKSSEDTIYTLPLGEAEQHTWDAAIHRFHSDPTRAMIWMNFHDSNRKARHG